MTTMLLEDIAPNSGTHATAPRPHQPTSSVPLGAPSTERHTTPVRRLMEAEPMAGIVALQFLKNLMDLNPVLRRPVEHRGLDELEWWESLWTSVYDAPFDAMLTTGSAAASDSIERVGENEWTAESGGSAIGEALLWTLESCFRDDFTPAARTAWETLYRFVREAR